MARRPDSDALGTVECPTPGCDQVALVFRSNRRGNHLYARCPDCKTMQNTSKAAQAHFAKALDRSEPSAKPSQTAKPKPSETVPDQDDFDPGEIQDEPTKAPQTRRRSPFGLLLLVLAVGGGLISLKV